MEENEEYEFDDCSLFLTELLCFVHMKWSYLINSAEAEFWAFAFEVLPSA